jgi:hypothetical protein
MIEPSWGTTFLFVTQSPHSDTETDAGTKTNSKNESVSGTANKMESLLSSSTDGNLKQG